MLTVNNHTSGLCCMITAMTADCAPPRKFIHVVIDSGAGYFFMVNACSTSSLKGNSFSASLTDSRKCKLKSNFLPA